MKTQTWTDPIVEETRAWRAAVMAESDNDLEKLVAKLKISQQRHGARLVNLMRPQGTASLRRESSEITETQT